MVSLLQYSHVPVISYSLLSKRNRNELCALGRCSKTYMSIFVASLEAICATDRVELRTDSRHYPGNLIPVLNSILACCVVVRTWLGMPRYKLRTFRMHSIEPSRALSLLYRFMLNTHNRASESCSRYEGLDALQWSTILFFRNPRLAFSCTYVHQLLMLVPAILPSIIS